MLLPEFYAVCGQFVIASNRALVEYVDDLSDTEMNYWSVYAGADFDTGIISDGTNTLTRHYFTGSADDGNLMLYDTALATPVQAFGANRQGAGFCFGIAGYGEVIWLARHDDAGFPISDRFISLRRTGGTWEDKTGDWIAVFGSWLGFVAGHSMPTPATISIIAPP